MSLSCCVKIVSLSLLGLALSPGRLAAQGSPLLLSLSGDDQLAGQPVGDEEILLHAPGAPARLLWPGSTLALHMGSNSSSGLFQFPGDVDALHDPGDGSPGGGLWFSLVSDQAGWLDGDILAMHDGVVERVWSESTLMTALGTLDGNIDLDALLLDDDGRLLLSLAENEDSNLLAGDTPGQIDDGDVLSWDPLSGAVAVVHTESEIGAMVSHALGISANPGDVKSLARNPADGSLLFSVQSPSSDDGSVFSTADGGSLLAGQTEADLGFSGSGELDALSLATSIWAGLDADEDRPAAGGSVTLVLNGSIPGEASVLLLSTEAVPSWFPLGGWGGLVLSEDLLFDVSLKAFPFLIRVADGTGSSSWSFDIPSMQLPQDVVLQAACLSMPHGVSNPVLLEVAQ